MTSDNKKPEPADRCLSRLVRPPSSEWKAEGWDIMLQCTACGFRVRRHRNDYNGAIGDAPKPTVTTTCSNCTCNAGYPPGDVKTVHFIDYATKAELAAHA